jgi:hypothetical protein
VSQSQVGRSTNSELPVCRKPPTASSADRRTMTVTDGMKKFSRVSRWKAGPASTCTTGAARFIVVIVRTGRPSASISAPRPQLRKVAGSSKVGTCRSSLSAGQASSPSRIPTSDPRATASATL